MLSYVYEAVVLAERNQAVQTREAAFAALRGLGLDDFGEVLLQMPHQAFPKLSRLLPGMSPPDVQNLWTGNNGYPLLRQSCSFARSLSYNYNKITARLVQDADILDFGCGYGRIARLMYYFSKVDSVYGVDPWLRSVEELAAANMGEHFRQSDYLPKELPVGDKKFDLAYAFSVFTHLSERATKLALSTVRKHMKPEGVFCITIRPPEYWDLTFSEASEAERVQMKNLHESAGFAFCPHRIEPVDGEVTYGDTSMSFRWLSEAAIGWRIAGIDRSLEDPYQIYVFLQTV